MQQFFNERVAFEKAKLAAYRPFHDRFFVGAYKAFSPHFMLRSCESEKVCSIESSSSRRETTVITSATFRSIKVKLRYRLRRRSAGWIITKVEGFCKLCNGTGKVSGGCECIRCEGKGWDRIGT